MEIKPADTEATATRPHAGDAANDVQAESLARQHAQTHVLNRRRGHELSLLEHLEEREQLVREATVRFGEVSAAEPLSRAAEWVLDNYYLVQQSLRQVREDMPPGFYRQLPKLDAGPMAGFPRVFAVAQELIVSSEAHLEMDRVTRFMHLYQDFASLTMGELWALPAMLRLGILECLAQAIGRVAGLQREHSLPAMTLSHATVDDEIVANCIVSLRTLAIQDWQVFFESVSQVEQVLREDPANVYAAMDRQTRDRYRKVVEELAQGTSRDEHQVARAAIELAQQHATKLSTCKETMQSPRAAHVGYYLLDAGRTQLEVRVGHRVSLRDRLSRWVLHHPTLVYLGCIGSLAAILLSAGMGYARESGAPLQWLAAGLLLLIPALTVSVSLVNWMISLAVPPRVLPKMDFKDSIPTDCKTLVVIPSLLSSAAEVKSLLEELEQHFLRNQDSNLYFALLTDLPDTPQPRRPGDDVFVEQAASGIGALNARYPRETAGPFYLLHRDARWNPSEGQWMGWERKRGKLHQLNLLLRGSGETAFSVQTGDLGALREIKYVITLDADTILPLSAARRLIGALAHPLNQAEFDPDSGAVTAGYTLLQPGIEITSTSANLSRFTRIFAGDVGLDLYTRAVSNAYQDLFGEGIYVGKGIYDVDAFERSLAGRMPENTLLSHDLIEGIHGRVGLTTDVVLYEAYPAQYFVHMRRSRRWIRGDWQLLPWLFPRVPSAGKGTIPNDLSAIARWKILDNLRRSLLAPALFVLFVAGWLWLPGLPMVWTLAGVLTPGVPVLTGLVLGLSEGVRGERWSPKRVLRSLRNGVVRWILELVFLLYETLFSLGGIATTLFRIVVTRKRMLQWLSYADSMRLDAGVTWQQMLTAMLTAAALALLILLVKPGALMVASPLLVAWLLSPEIAAWISRPSVRAQVSLSVEERQRLRNLARRTWIFFEQFVGPEDHWLPPDHFQEAPRGIVAHSTSPTDLGLLLLSTLSAYDFGYIGLWDLSARLRDTFESMERLETYQGHFLNWYDTRSLEPLPPRYVSTVDSGNLVACLRTLVQGCRDLGQKSVLRWQNWEGLLDALGLLDEIASDLQTAGLKPAVTPLRAQLAQLREQVHSAQDDPAGWGELLTRLTGEGWSQVSQSLLSLVDAKAPAMDAGMLRRLRLSADQVQNHLYGMQREMERLSPWLVSANRPPDLFTRADVPPVVHDAWQALQDSLPTAPSLDELGKVCTAGLARLAELQDRLDEDALRAWPERTQARDWCVRLQGQLQSAATTADALAIGFREIGERSEQYFEDMDFGFLFDAQRQLFHIGYNVAAEQLDSNYYDLLASEARIASIVAIAENQVPPSHWLHLGRPLTQEAGAPTILSWGGTLFEYLMPALMMRSFD
ncbi:MAG: cellobiose phosphorylase, partial [Chloroflexi bacterium]|nr:cellobiose phosphorylase [Chloroflexota bacterium]